MTVTVETPLEMQLERKVLHLKAHIKNIFEHQNMSEYFRRRLRIAICIDVVIPKDCVRSMLHLHLS